MKQYIVTIAEYDEAGEGLYICNSEPFATKEGVIDFIVQDYTDTVCEYDEEDVIEIKTSDIKDGACWNTPSGFSVWVQWKVFVKDVPKT